MLGLYSVFSAGSIFLRLIKYAILLYCILSWFQPRHRAFYMLQQFISPFVAPFQRLSRRLMQSFNMPFDFSCWFAIIALQIGERLWWRLYMLLRLRL